MLSFEAQFQKRSDNRHAGAPSMKQLVASMGME